MAHEASLLDDTAVAEGAGSTSADPNAQADTSAGTQNTGSQAAQVPFHEHPRWQQLMRERAGERQALDELRRQNAELQSRLGQFQPKQKTEEELAREALHKLDPSIPKYGERLDGIEGMVGSLIQRNFIAEGDGLIGKFAEQHGIPAQALSAAVVEMIQHDPALLQRAQKGDLGLIHQSLRLLQPVVTAMKTQGAQAQRQQDATLGQTKQNVRNLPPRSAVGTTPGAAAPDHFDPQKDDARSYWEKGLARMRQITREASSA